MTTPANVEANRQNALLSTGPRTPAGKRRSAKNALRHGLRSELPVVPGERPEDWEAHRTGILRSLAPAGALEEALAGRVALCLWRLNRAAAYEMAVTAVGLDEVEDDARKQIPFAAEKAAHERLEKTLQALEKKRETVDLWEGTLRLLERLPELPDEAPVDGDDAYGAFQDFLDGAPDGADHPDADDDEFPAALGVPEEELDAAYSWNGWTAGMVRQGLARYAQAAKTRPERLLARATQGRMETQEEGKAEVARLEAEAKELRRQIRTQEDRLRLRRMLPDGATLDRVTRYEAHLTRQMLQALHELQRLQAVRGGQPVPAPAALDVTLDAGEPAVRTLRQSSGVP